MENEGTSFFKIIEADHSKEEQPGSDQDLIHHKVIGYKYDWPVKRHSKSYHSEGRKAHSKRLLLVASSLVERVGDSLASVGQTLLSRLHHAAALLLGGVGAGAGRVAKGLGGGLVALWCAC
jgi:hypothetical protein